MTLARVDVRKDHTFFTPAAIAPRGSPPSCWKLSCQDHDWTSRNGTLLWHAWFKVQREGSHLRSVPCGECKRVWEDVAIVRLPRFVILKGGSVYFSFIIIVVTWRSELIDRSSSLLTVRMGLYTDYVQYKHTVYTQGRYILGRKNIVQ